MGKTEKLRKIAITCGKLREIVKLRKIVKDCRPQSPPLAYQPAGFMGFGRPVQTPGFKSWGISQISPVNFGAVEGLEMHCGPKKW